MRTKEIISKYELTARVSKGMYAFWISGTFGPFPYDAYIRPSKMTGQLRVVEHWLTLPDDPAIKYPKRRVARKASWILMKRLKAIPIPALLAEMDKELQL